MRTLVSLVLLCVSTLVSGADAPWLTYRVYSGELALRDPQPKVAVFVDGRVQVYRAAWQPHSGLYQYRLSADALQELVDSVTEPALLATDLVATEAALAAAGRRLARDEQRYYAISDPDVYHVEIRAAAAPGSRVPDAAPAALVWEMVHPALEQAAASRARAGLVALGERLQALAVIDGAERVADAAALSDGSPR